MGAMFPLNGLVKVLWKMQPVNSHFAQIPGSCGVRSMIAKLSCRENFQGSCGYTPTTPTLLSIPQAGIFGMRDAGMGSSSFMSGT